MPNLIEIIKQAALDAVKESAPTALVFGEVVSVSPLKIKVDQKLTLEDAHLILTNNVKDHQITITDGSTRTITVKNALIVGDGVLMTRMQGGQKFIVTDKVVI